MPPESLPPASQPLDLLVVGGLTIDRFPAGVDEPGGSVLHIARALAGRATRLGVITASGTEPAARRGLAELEQLCDTTQVTAVDRTITYRHQEEGGARRLWLEHGGGTLPSMSATANRSAPRSVLFAPLAGEVGTEWLVGWNDRSATGAILQGWLRAVDSTGEIHARPVGALRGDLRASLRSLDLLVASEQDVAADGEEPRAQLGALRRAVGPTPTLVLTCGIEGVWLSSPQTGAHREDPWHVPVPWRVDDVSTVGAGDVLAAAMLAGGWAHSQTRASVGRLAEAAMYTVAEHLEKRHLS